MNSIDPAPFQKYFQDHVLPPKKIHIKDVLHAVKQYDGAGSTELKELPGHKQLKTICELFAQKHNDQLNTLGELLSTKTRITLREALLGPSNPVKIFFKCLGIRIAEHAKTASLYFQGLSYAFRKELIDANDEFEKIINNPSDDKIIQKLYEWDISHSDLFLHVSTLKKAPSPELQDQLNTFTDAVTQVNLAKLINANKIFDDLLQQDISIEQTIENLFNCSKQYDLSIKKAQNPLLNKEKQEKANTIIHTFQEYKSLSEKLPLFIESQKKLLQMYSSLKDLPYSKENVSLLREKTKDESIKEKTIHSLLQSLLPEKAADFLKKMELPEFIELRKEISDKIGEFSTQESLEYAKRNLETYPSLLQKNTPLSEEDKIQLNSFFSWALDMRDHLRHPDESFFTNGLKELNIASALATNYVRELVKKFGTTYLNKSTQERYTMEIENIEKSSLKQLLSDNQSSADPIGETIKIFKSKEFFPISLLTDVEISDFLSKITKKKKSNEG